MPEKRYSKKSRENELNKHYVSFIMDISSKGSLYYRYRRPLELNYARKIVSGTFDKDLAIKGLDSFVNEGIKLYTCSTKPPARRKVVATLLLAEMMPNINKYVKDMRKLKTAKKPWFTAGL